jgi:predicted pyridoxine 5'-phosphate oxidase superfamily flavin-nucleotide-binding protein
MIPKKVSEVLKSKEFIYVATCDFSGRPNVAPKFMLKIESHFVYLVDFVFGKTWENLKINPKASLSFMNIDNLTGYQINGSVEILSKGKEYDNIIKEFQEREISFTTNRIIEGVQKERKSENFEVAFPERVVIFKITTEELVEIGHTGKLARQNL